MIFFTYSWTIENWKMVFNQGEYKLTTLIILIVPFMLCLKPDQEWVNPRDLAGMYVLVASFDILQFSYQRSIDRQKYSCYDNLD